MWGESGELVCTKPLPCQPTHFWNDENGSKYRKAYFSRFPGAWGLGQGVWECGRGARGARAGGLQLALTPTKVRRGPSQLILPVG